MEVITSFFVIKPSNFIMKNFRLNHTWPSNVKRMNDEWVEHNPDFDKPYLKVFNKQRWVESYDVELDKPENTYRIFYVGDSFTDGTAPMDQSVPSIVEKYLNEQCHNSGVNFEVINTGTWSYSPVIYYILIRYYISQYSPDLIVLNIDMTDVFDDWKYRQTMIEDSMGNPWAAPPPVIFMIPPLSIAWMVLCGRVCC